MNFTLTFSHIADGQRVPLFIDGREATLQIEASSKTDAIYKPEVKTFCGGRTDDARVRRVT